MGHHVQLARKRPPNWQESSRAESLRTLGLYRTIQVTGLYSEHDTNMTREAAEVIGVREAKHEGIHARQSAHTPCGSGASILFTEANLFR